ncbi:amidohydrolase family protein [Neobacillus citreus]|uniref:Amidohydrolase family protein n=1 Tax=Neobacillus citreus TaxID=2833578 RepID=A0A942YBM8_9BACI|nr:amidohydrolase family protein [Neobacillus citreus]MCH6264969.1 amidohydrolase family protein [Neobacillus citreus]
MAATAIINAQVYQDSTGDFSRQTILLEDGYISDILPPTVDLDLPESSIMDAEGLYLTPGLIDTCSQIGLKEVGIRWEGHDGYEPDWEDGFDFNVIDGIYPFDKAFQDAAAFGVTTAHIVSSPESVVGAKTAVIHTTGKTVDEMAVVPSFGFSFSMGDVPKNAYWEKTKTPLTRMGIALRIRTALKKLQSLGALEDVPVFIRSHRADDIATAFRIAGEFKLQFVLVHGTEYPLAWNLPTGDVSFSVVAGPVFQAMERGELRHLNPSLYYALYSGQIPFTFATDHPVSSVTHLQKEGALALKAGVPEQVILNGLTRDAAKLLKIDHLTGRVDKGLFADLVLWNEHPLELTARAVRTFIKGKEVYRWE